MICPEFGAKIRGAGATAVRIDMTRNISAMDFKSLASIYLLLLREKPDIVHLHSSKAGLLGRVAAKLAGARKIIYTPNAWSFYQKQGIMRRMYIIAERMLGRITDVVICVSESEAEDAIRNRICPGRKIELVHNGVSTEALHCRRKRENERFTVGWAGRNCRQKNLQMLMRVADALPKIRFVAITDRAISHRNIECLRWADDMRRFYCQTDILANTSLYEGMPYTVLEAMAARKPVVATNAAGNRDAIEDGKTGFLVSSRHGMVEAIRRLAGDKSLRISMGNAGRKRVMEKFSLGRMIAMHKRIYRSL
jgi:glycosyltransferase involved in cell wall biosynthesis